MNGAAGIRKLPSVCVCVCMCAQEPDLLKGDDRVFSSVIKLASHKEEEPHGGAVTLLP